MNPRQASHDPPENPVAHSPDACLQSAARLQAALESAGLATWDWPHRGGTGSWSRLAYEMLGYRPDEVAPSYEAWIRRVHPDDAPTVAATFTECCREERDFLVEFRVVPANGETRWLEARGRCVRGSDGECHCSGVMLDITPRQKTLAHLQEGQRRERERAEEFEALFRSVPAAVWISKDPECLSITGNPESYRILRAPEGTNLSATRDSPEPDSRGFVEYLDGRPIPPTELPMQKVARTGEDLEGAEITLVFTDGTARHIYGNVSALKAPDGSVRGAVSAFIDVTDRKEAEARMKEREHFLQRITEVTPDLLHVYELTNRRTIFINRPIASLLGYSPEEIDAGQLTDPLQLLHPDDSARWQAHLERLHTLGPDEFADFDHRLKHRDGHWRWFQTREALFSHAEGHTRQIIGATVDVHARRTAEDALRASEERFRHLADAMPQLVWIAADDGVVTYYNSQAAQYKGLTQLPDGKWAWEPAVHPDDVAETLSRWQAAIAGGPSYQCEHRIGMKDGTFRWHLSRAFRSFAADGSSQWFGTGTDIHEVKLAQEVLHRNAALFSTLIKQAPGGVYVVDAEFKLREVNPEAMSIFKSIESFWGMDFELVLTTLWGGELGRQCADIFRHTLETGERYVCPQFSEVRQDIGTLKSYEWETQRITLPDGQHGVVCYFRDVTESARAEQALRESEERMRLATEATGVGIWEWNIENGTIWWDSQMFRIYGLPPTPDGVVPYDVWTKAVLQEDLPAQETAIHRTLALAGRGNREFRIRRALDGQIRHLQSVEIVNLDRHGRQVTMVGTNLDITDRKQAETALSDEARKKDEFLAMLGHELRNPLNAIRHAVSISQSAATSPHQRAHATHVIDRQTHQLARMVDDLLDVARINRGRIDLRQDPVDLATVLAHAVEVVRPLLDERHHILSIQASPDLTVLGDDARLEQVFVNILNNAAKYTPAGGNIHVTAYSHDSWIHVRIEDNGVGIPPELLPHVFELFRQADSSLDRAHGGLGIGLSVVKSLVEMHSGSIRAESRGTGAGSAITVTLPAYARPAAADGALPPDGAPPSSTTMPRVLLVDDHLDSANVLSLLLTIHEFEVRMAHSGPDGVAAAIEYRPDVLLIDLGLPGYDGFEVVRRLRQAPECAGAFFVAVSGYAQEEDRARCLAAGFDRHCAKPINLQTLLEMIRHLASR